LLIFEKNGKIILNENAKYSNVNIFYFYLKSSFEIFLTKLFDIKIIAVSTFVLNIQSQKNIIFLLDIQRIDICGGVN